MKPTTQAALELTKACCRLLDEKKAEHLAVLDVSEQSSITDFLIVGTATSSPHLRALRVELEKLLDSQKVHLVGVEAPQDSGWVVLDAFDVMVHLFLSETRERYGLERLWRDASEVNVGKLLGLAPTKKIPLVKKPQPKAKAKVKAKAKPKPTPVRKVTKSK